MGPQAIIRTMPTNTSPEYKTAEAAYRRARDPQEKLDCLREMHRTIPKHKGTEHLRAGIKTRIKELTEELSTGQKTGARGGPPTVIRREGAAQIALIGPPNSGKSALHARLTGSHAASEPYPFATQFPQPGMYLHDDVAFQLVDLPSLSPEHPIPWIGNALQPADGALFVVDLGTPGCLERAIAAMEILEERNVILREAWPATAIGHARVEGDDLFATYLPTLLVANKSDQTPDLTEELEVFEELTEFRFPFMAVSAVTGAGLDELGAWLFRMLEIVRVYTKVPGEDADMGPPFTVRRGDTVHDVATLVHRDIAARFKYARVWGTGTFDGQQVGKDHVVDDGDVLEIHA